MLCVDIPEAVRAPLGSAITIAGRCERAGAATTLVADPGGEIGADTGGGARLAYGGGVIGLGWSDGMSLTLASVPFGQALGMIATTLDGGEGQIEWFGDSIQAPGMTLLMLLSMLVYMLVSLGFFWRAMRTFRRNIV